jgi:hypothetical protein
MIALIANWKRILYGTALALLGTLLLVQTARIEGALFWKGLKAENTELRETLAKVEQAQKLATKLAKEEKARIEAENERKANDARELEKKLRSDYDARLSRWLQNNRRSTGQANLPETGSPAQGTAGESGLAQLPEEYAIVPVNDLQLSAEAFAKLEALQNWAKSVIE